MTPPDRPCLSRRAFLASTGAAGLSSALAGGLALPSLSRASNRPPITHGLQSGDTSGSRAIVWARTDRPAEALVEWATTESFEHPVRLPAIAALPEADYTVKAHLEDLPPGQQIFYRVRFRDLSDLNALGEPSSGRLRTSPAAKRTIRFVWSADTAGQGWGIDPAHGGMLTYAAMLRHDPDFFIHSGDTIYADDPILPEVILPNGGTWRNIVTEEKAKVAETLAEFRANYKYNLMDAHVRAFNAAVPILAQWDDHEVTNNWYPSRRLDADPRYTDKSAALLAARAARAFHEFMPIASTPVEPARVYRKVSYGPLLDIFFLDMRTYRGPNSHNAQKEPGPETVFLGADQLAWLRRELMNSRATWKVMAADMPIGLIVYDDFRTKQGFEAVANADHSGPLGRELEIAGLLSFIKHAEISNTVWLTADVHYTAAHRYDPARAAFQDFEPFWEFVSGPLHAGTFGPNPLDRTFGPEAVFVKAPPPGQFNLPPSAGLQFFGLVTIDGSTEQMTVSLRDRADQELWSITLDPVRRPRQPL